MKTITRVASLLALTASPVFAECYGSGGFYSCYDLQSGNSYTVQNFGDQTTMRGSNSRTGSSWTQDSMDIGGGITTHRGRAANGGDWNMTTIDIGGGYSTYSGRDSDGNYFSGTCSSLFGCN